MEIPTHENTERKFSSFSEFCNEYFPEGTLRGTNPNASSDSGKQLADRLLNKLRALLNPE